MVYIAAAAFSFSIFMALCFAVDYLSHDSREPIREEKIPLHIARLSRYELLGLATYLECDNRVISEQNRILMRQIDELTKKVNGGT